jgi:flagellum-specific peptidoglycan hydrolase FlgJ
LESAWGTSELAIKANNLFGRKVWKGGPDVISIPTREFLHGSWVTVPAFWKVFPNMEASFVDRMEILRSDPRYAATLRAAVGEEYLAQVSKVWSTDPNRAKDVLSIWREHHSALSAVA